MGDIRSDREGAATGHAGVLRQLGLSSAASAHTGRIAGVVVAIEEYLPVGLGRRLEHRIDDPSGRLANLNDDFGPCRYSDDELGHGGVLVD
jgi:hypothetical protein